LVAHTGDEAPGSGGRTFLSFFGGAAAGSGGEEPFAFDIDGPVLNQAGDVAFNAYVDPIDPANWIGDEGIWVHDTSGLTLVALAGDPAPGTAGLPFLRFNHVNFDAMGVFSSGKATRRRAPAQRPSAMLSWGHP
jgi:hypothetical protein